MILFKCLNAFYNTFLNIFFSFNYECRSALFCKFNLKNQINWHSGNQSITGHPHPNCFTDQWFNIVTLVRWWKPEEAASQSSAVTSFPSFCSSLLLFFCFPPKHPLITVLLQSCNPHCLFLAVSHCPPSGPCTSPAAVSHQHSLHPLLPAFSSLFPPPPLSVPLTSLRHGSQIIWCKKYMK